MDQSMSELIEAYNATLDKGVTGVLVLFAVALVIGTLAYFWTKRTGYKVEANKGKADTALAEMFGKVLEQHRTDSNSVIQNNTIAMDRNVETRERYTLAFNETTHALENVTTTLRQLNLDLSSRQSLVEGTVSDVSTRLQTLIGVVSAVEAKVNHMATVLNQLPNDYAQTAALVRGLAAEIHQLNEWIMSTSRVASPAPTPPALIPTLTPEQ